MDKTREIFKFQALLKHAGSTSDDLSAEMHYQKEILRTLGVSDGEINNLIHDRYAREGISIARAALAVAEIRQAGRLPAIRMRPPQQPPSTAERAAEYLRARGREPRPLSPPASAPQTTQDSHPTARNGELLVPYGVDPDANVVRARDAAQNVSYSCPHCASVLVLHAGDVRVKHFAHKPSTACDGESVMHITAKLLVDWAIREHAAAKQQIHLSCTCHLCNSTFERGLPPESFSASAVEYPVREFFCDVVALKDDRPVLAIEILHTHSVGDFKADGLGLPWIELAATDVLDDPLRWKPIQSRLKPTICPNCKEALKRLSEVAARWNLPLPETHYRAAIASCWNCHEEILWYWWPGVPFAEKTPPAPIPPIVRQRYSKAYGGKYWMNVCPGCGQSQGDNFVFLAKDSPFRGLALNETEAMRQHRIRQNEAVASEFMRIVRRNI